jgi:hypothetical protein
MTIFPKTPRKYNIFGEHYSHVLKNCYEKNCQIISYNNWGLTIHALYQAGIAAPVAIIKRNYVTKCLTAAYIITHKPTFLNGRKKNN